MKKEKIIFLVLLFISFLQISCSVSHNTVQNPFNREYDTLKGGQIHLWVYDGKTAKRYILSEKEERIRFAQETKDVVVKVAKSSFPKDHLPWYGIEINYNYPETDLVYAAWSDGYLITSEGEVISFDMDFDSLLERYTWYSDENQEYEKATVFPCSSKINQADNKWHVENLIKDPYDDTEREEVMIKAEIDKGNPYMIQAEVTLNEKKEELNTIGIGIGTVDVEEGGAWYRIPCGHEPGFMPGSYLDELEVGKPKVVYLDVRAMYGEILPGKYRWRMLVSGELYLDFQVDKNGAITLLTKE